MAILSQERLAAAVARYKRQCPGATAEQLKVVEADIAEAWELGASQERARWQALDEVAHGLGPGLGELKSGMQRIGGTAEEFSRAAMMMLNPRGAAAQLTPNAQAQVELDAIKQWQQSAVLQHAFKFNRSAFVAYRVATASRREG